MKVGMMQPYAFPYLGYFQLIRHSDLWVVFDDTQFVRKSWVNRNRILHPEPDKRWQYLSIPVQRAPLGTSIRSVRIDQDSKWKESFLGKLTSYRQAPYYSRVRNLLVDCLDAECSSIAEWNVFALRSVCEYLGIRFDYLYSSAIPYVRTSISHSGQWALEAATHLRASEYVNPIGGHKLFRNEEFTARGLELRYLRPMLTSYSQRRAEFVEALSILDVMMWNNIEQIQQMLDAYEIFAHERAKEVSVYALS